MKKIVTKKILALYDKYDGDLGLLDEPWASKKDIQEVNLKQSQILSDYIDQLNFLNVKNISEELKNQTYRRIRELEEYIDPEVIIILKERMGD